LYFFPHLIYISQSVHVLTIHWAKTLRKGSVSGYQKLSSVSVLISLKVLYKDGKTLYLSFASIFIRNKWSLW